MNHTTKVVRQVLLSVGNEKGYLIPSVDSSTCLVDELHQELTVVSNVVVLKGHENVSVGIIHNRKPLGYHMIEAFRSG